MDAPRHRKSLFELDQTHVQQGFYFTTVDGRASDELLYPFKCIQRVIDIRHARSEDRAVEAAELRYERFHCVHDWTLHADFLELEVDGKKVDYCPPGVRRPRWN